MLRCLQAETPPKVDLAQHPREAAYISLYSMSQALGMPIASGGILDMDAEAYCFMRAIWLAQAHFNVSRPKG